MFGPPWESWRPRAVHIITSVHQILTHTTYIGQHRFNTRDHKTRAAKPAAEHAGMEVPPRRGDRKLDCCGHVRPSRA